MLEVYGWLQESNRMGTSYCRSFTTEKFGQGKSQSSRCHEKNASYMFPLIFFLFYFLISRLAMSKKEEVQDSFLASSWKRRGRLLLEGTGTTQVRFKRFHGYVLL